ncbi:MAG TPA: 1,4-alpha-glucan branching protein domain-containing protein [Acidiferrobacterales bacterium]|nr:1,4-alpha-glucan branching protein domain-containing protein [Acidiferrobacterales bacterium]
MEPKGYFALVLHAHLPFVRHPEYKRFLEEDWFFEALTETYLPLLDVFEGLVRDGVHFRITLSLTPPLLSMMSDPLLQQRYLNYLDERLEALAGEQQRTASDANYHPVVLFYTELFTHLRKRFVEQDRMNVSQSFRRLMEAGHLEIITCGATHGYFPLLAVNEESIYAQLSMAVRTHERILGRKPRGIWLPECGYKPGVDRILNEFGIDYFILDSHGLLNAEPRPRYGVHRPIRTPGGPAAFARDYESSKQVWSAEEGYPGDHLYREFYRDAGFDVHQPHIEKLRHAGIATFTGLKYHRITGKTAWKEPYHPGWARERAAEHAGHFLFNRQQQVQWLTSFLDRPPVILAPYDAELFGHWWFEGPQWIDFLLRKMAYDQSDVKTITPAEYIDWFGDLQPASPPECSWGAGGYHEVWLNGANDWIYPYLHAAAERMSALVQRFPDAQGMQRWALDQAARELLLAQSSDWAFIMKTGTSVEYAVRRQKTHIHRFDRLATMAESGDYDEGYLREVAARDSPFPDMDYRIFQTRPWV